WIPRKTGGLLQWKNEFKPRMARINTDGRVDRFSSYPCYQCNPWFFFELNLKNKNSPARNWRGTTRPGGANGLRQLLDGRRYFARGLKCEGRSCRPEGGRHR